MSKVKLPFGKEETINIFPSRVSTESWAGVAGVLGQDLGDNSLYQEFERSNAAYIPSVAPTTAESASLAPTPTEEPGTSEAVSNDPSPSYTPSTPPPAPSNVPATSSGPASVLGTSTDTTGDNPANAGVIDPSIEPATANEAGPEFTDKATSAAPTTDPGPAEASTVSSEASAAASAASSEPARAPEPEPATTPTSEPASSESVSLIDRAGEMVWGVFAKATRAFPFAQQSVVTSVTSTATEVESEISTDTATESQPESASATTTTTSIAPPPAPPVSITEASTTESASASSTTPMISEQSEAPISATGTVSVPPVATESEALPVTSPEPTTDASSTTAVGPAATTSDDRLMHELVLENFGTAPLESGQFITSMQLRMSLAGQLADNVATGSLPYLEILYGAEGEEQSVGTVLIDDEVSNAINGGFYLFALPVASTIDDLAEKRVLVRFHGSRDSVNGLYLDAAWIELDTKVVSREDIAARGVAKELRHLPGPQLLELKSEQLNFRRSDLPQFNLRYTSQRNVLVRGVRDLFGRKLAKVDAVTIAHHSLGPSGIEPDVTVTDDGLVTIQVPEDERSRLRPGQYDVTVVMNEGGYRTTDTFSFQWGILTINPNKTEYEHDETVELSIGALTLNGNTICRANLDLYVIAPNEYIQKVPVRESGQCDGNNVTDTPDFLAETVAALPGEYELYLERLDDQGELLSFTSDTFHVVASQDLSIERIGPTRIYPPAPYPMELTVAATQAFDGFLTERVPANFEVFDTDATISRDGAWQVLTWPITMMAGESRTVSYRFDAPDLSPYLYNLGPASLQARERTERIQDVVELAAAASSTSTSSPAVSTGASQSFTEHRQWQIASDALGNMLLFYDDTEASLPSTWNCVSCTSGQDFFQTFIRASSTYNNTGGALTHTHSAVSVAVNNTTSGVVVENTGTGVLSANTHDHTASLTLGSGSNIPSYRELRVIRYNVSAGEPAAGDIPQGAIAIFDASVPTGWTRYSAQDGYYIRAGNSPGSVSGSNTHSHTITSGTLNAATGDIGRRGGNPSTNAINTGHTHTVTGSSASASNEPEYIEVILGQIDADGDPVNGMIAMWDAAFTSDGGWESVSSAPSDPFTDRFLKAAATYGSTGGVNSHAHATTTVASGNAVGGVTSGRTNGASDGVVQAHTHDVDFSTSDDEHLPPYLTVNFAKRIGLDATYSQLSYRWYVNRNNQTPNDPWDDSTIDLNEREPITATSTPVQVGDVVRLRLNALVNNATSTAGDAFQLQFATTTSVCTAATTWTDVGETASSTVWRGYDNGSVADGSTLSSTTLASSTVFATYEEGGATAVTPSDIGENGVGEWDFVLENNGAAPGAIYCFRLVDDTGSELFAYQSYPQLFTNQSPNAPTLSKLFDNEKTASTSPWFQFVTTDPEGETVHYEIEVDNNYDFSSPLLSSSTANNDDTSFFKNQVNLGAKEPYASGELIEFKSNVAFASGTTYYWRVRSLDPNGSNEWGEWSEIWSFTIDPNLSAAAWFQTQDEQFATNANVGVETGSDSLSFISGSTTGTSTSGAITFADGEVGTAWDSFRFNDSGSITYYVEYQDANDAWQRIPDGDLSGNSTGFTAVDSPVSLLTLDVDTYAVIRLVAVFTNTSPPTLNDWEVRWGFRVETPTISTLFPNEQTGTTTPTFTFTTTDPQGDGLDYQVQWSLTPDFAASTTRTSDTDAGFLDPTTGSTTGVFSSGADVRYTIQSADALTGTTTYWWRVRAKDTNGANAYSFWTDPRSFTVIPGTEVSTWFQTTQEQFDTNVLSGTLALPTDVVTVATTATEAMIVYGEGTQTTPRYRVWDGSAWGEEGSLGDVGSTLRWAVVRAGTTREEYVAGVLDAGADLNVQVYSNGAWSSPTEFSASAGINSTRGFDIAYENLSGDAMVVYCDGDTAPSYRIWNGSSWSSETGITSNLTDNCRWIDLASRPDDNEIALIMRGVGGDPYEVLIWNATTSSWGNSSTFGASRNSTYSGQAIAYLGDGSEALAVAPSPGGGPNRFVYNYWTPGGSWSGEQTNTGIQGRLHWAGLAQGTSELMMCYMNDETTSDVQAIPWTGTTNWGTDVEHTAAANSNVDPGFACIYEDDGSSALAVYGDSGTTQTSYETWNGTSWTTTDTQINSLTTTDTMQLVRTGDGTILGAFYDGDTTSSLEFSSWNGSTWSTTQTLESGASVTTSPYGQPYFMAPRNENSAGTAIVSPAIDFDDGLGPYWQRFSWNDTTPGTSEILYSLQYQTSTGTWAFIPDSELPDNEAGTSTGPIDLTGLDTNTYNVIRPYAQLSCDTGGSCPELQDWKVEWAGGITISGTITDYDQLTALNSGQVGVAVNGAEQASKVGTINPGGTWSIGNVTAFVGDVITVFVKSTSTPNQAVGVARYSGQGNMSGIELARRHVSVGSTFATTTPYTTSDIGGFDSADSTDVFTELSGNGLNLCAVAGCADVRLAILPGAIVTPGGALHMHDLENNGTFVAGSYTHQLTGSWDNNGTSTMTGSTIAFTATSTSESVDSTGAVTDSFNNVSFGTTTGSATWTLASAFDVNGDLTVTRGTLARGSAPITVAGDLLNAANGTWTGIGTTTFDGGTAATWADQNTTLQNIGNVVIDGSVKTVTLAGNVAANRVVIGGNDTLDASGSHYDITVYDNWTNNNTFLPRNGEVFMAATTSGKRIITGGDAFYDLTFTGPGDWSFPSENDITINHDLSIASGTVNLPTGTTTIAGSFDSATGTFANSNGTLFFTSDTAETIALGGSGFTNVAYRMTFNGGGSWSMVDTHATATDDVRVEQGAVTFPSGTFAIGGTLTDAGGSFAGNGGTVRFYSSGAESITAGGSTFASTTFDGTGSWSFSDTNVTVAGSVRVENGTLSLPSGTFSVGGSYVNNATVSAGTGEVEFNSTDSGESIELGGDPLYDLTFNSPTGGWTIVGDATTTNDVTLSAASDWTLQSGSLLSVGGVFTNSVGGASTTWTGTTLSLEAGGYSINTKADAGDAYDTLRIKANTDIKAWNSVATTYVVDSTGSFYSQDHNALDGDLYIFGDYPRATGTEYWTNDTDFDGTALSATTSRQVDVRFASGASATLASSTLIITGSSTASTTIANQGAGTYTLSMDKGTVTAQYYEFSDLGGSGFSLLGSTTVTSLANGSYTIAGAGGSGLTVAAATINTNPAKQIFNVRFATTTPISAFNVTQTDATPSSFWWFRDGVGNLYGEAFDNDDGNPGSIRFDDSALQLTISGTIYEADGTTPLGAPTCDNATPVVRIMVDGVEDQTVSCNAGSFTANNVTVVGDPTVTVYLNNAAGGEVASVITRTPTANITDLDLIVNRVIVRNEDTSALTIANLAVYDGSDDPTDLQFIASTSTTPDTLSVRAGNELRVFASSTFTPGGVVTLNGNAEANSYDGTLYLDGDATFTAFSSSTLTIGGRLALETGASFDAASSTVVMTATTTGKSISGPSEIIFADLTFQGAGGEWNLGTDIRIEGNALIASGTVTGTGDIYVEQGDLTGDGVLSLGGASVVTMARSNSLGGNSAWTFSSLTLGDGLVTGTTTPLFTSTTTVSGVLTISSAHFLDAGSTEWDLSGTGTVFVEDGTFLEDTSTIRYSGNGANVTDAQYYNLDLNAGAGTPTYTAINAGLVVDGALSVGGDAPSTFDLTANDPSIDVNGSVVIRSNGTLLASDSNTFTIAGSFDNNGTFTANSGTTTFDGSGTIDIAAGSSDFANVDISATGDVTVSEHATATGRFDLSTANSFTLTSGQVLAVGGVFANELGGAATTWTGSTLRLYGGGNYELNPKTVSDSYETLTVAPSTQVRFWNSDAETYEVASTGSLYSMDHADVAGDLYIFGAYTQSNANDFWSYARDFDGTALGGSSRVVDVYIATSSSVLVTGGALSVLGASGGSTTTIQSTATDLYDFRIGGTASVTMQYYAFRDMAAGGVTFSGTPDITELSNGDFELAVTGDTTVTVGSSVINSNPARTFNFNRFALGAAANGFNITATNTAAAISAWRFFGHSGDIDGEDFDVDSGDPGELLWDNSTSTIDISGRVYQSDASTVSAACGGGTNIHLYVNGSLENTTSCDSGTGLFTFNDVSYNTGESVVIYINNEPQDAVTVSTDLVSSVFNFDLYEDHLIVRHEGTDPVEIADLDDRDSDQDAADLFFDAETGPATLTLQADTKLIVWDSKEFAPGGDITTGGGAGDAFDGTIELQDDATLTLAAGQSHSIGGNLEMGTGATFTPSQSTVTFTSSGAGRTIDTNEGGFYDLTINGAGSFTSSDTVLPIANDLTLTSGAITLPVATTTITGSLSTTNGSFDANGGVVVFDGTGAETITASSSPFADLRFTGTGSWSMDDTNATATESVIVAAGSVTLPSGTFVVGGDFRNTGGSVTHNTSELIFTNGTSGQLLASSSDLFAVTIAGAGSFTMLDENLTLLDTLAIDAGSLSLASNTLSIGGSFLATGGTFSYPNPSATNTILFNSADTGETINPGVSSFDNVQIGAPSGGYTIVGNATTTGNFVLASASSFTVQSGVVLDVDGVFLNSVGGSATTWLGSTLALADGQEYSLNTKSSGGDQYDTLVIGANSDLKAWNSAATTTTVASSSSFYSQDNAGSDGSLYIYGDYHIGTTTEHWSYAIDFDGTALSGGSERAVTVQFANGATTTVSGGTLNIVGTSGNETTVTNQGAGTYALAVSDGTFNASYYNVRNLGPNGLDLTGTPTISSLDNGDFILALDGGTLISLSATALNANASLIISNTDFATTSSISGTNVSLNGTTPSVWTFSGGAGNLYGESFDVDGADACGSVRWDDSDCQITQQTHYRWRNDDGGLGVPADEWWDTDWNARKRVRIENADATTYTNAAVQLTVAYDSDMQADFDDLRFTDSDGTTLISHWIGSTTNSTVAEVWVKVPSLPASDTATVFMYYNNFTATSTSSTSATFIAGDDFEDGDIAEYSGTDAAEFSVNTSVAFDGSYSLNSGANDTGQTSNGGIARFDQTVSQGETIRFMKYIDSNSDANDEACMLFGVQSPVTSSNNYAVCFDHIGSTGVRLERDVVDDDDSGTDLAFKAVTFSTGWYEVEVDWGTDDSIALSLYDEAGALVATTSATDSTYTSGGYGFSFWFHYGAWDSVSSRPTLTTEPTVRFGAEQADGGATWAAALDATAFDFVPNDTARLRIAIENSGLATTGQQFLLEYAEQGSSPSCEAVSPASYAAVPVQSSCGTSPVCMQSSSNVTNGAATTDLLFDTTGDFTAGEAREDPSNITSSRSIGEDEYTELEYVVTPTSNVDDPNLCFRVTNNGSDYNTYLKVARMNVRFDPAMSTVYFNQGQDIDLTPGTTTRIFATTSVTDLNGYQDLDKATSTFYTTAVTAACTSDNNNCYISTNATTTGQCSFIDCADNTCTLSCYADMYFHADPTDDDGVGGLQWFAFLEVEDNQGGVDFGTNDTGLELITLRALEVGSGINYGTLSASSTSVTSPSTTVSNIGNAPIDVEIEGGDLSDGFASIIGAEQQKYSTSSFVYSLCGATCQQASTTPQPLEVDLSKPTSDDPPVQDEVYWGIRVPLGTNSAPHQGANTFYAVSDI